MRKPQIILIILILLAQTVYSQCDKSIRDKVIFTSLNYFQDSINGAIQNVNILLIDTTQYLEYPNLSFEPDIFSAIPDTSTLADLLIGFKKTSMERNILTTIKYCPRIHLTTYESVTRLLSDSAGWKYFNKVNPNAIGYYTTTEPFISDNYAIVYVENFCGNLCGSGYILYLHYRKDIDEWRIIYSKQIWVS